MPIKRPKLVNDEIYHVVMRGVGDSKIFKNKDDYYRAIFSLYEFNTTKSIEIRLQREKRQIIKKYGIPFSDSRDFLVGCLAFAFMPNHIHLLLKQLKDNGITKFMRKVGAGYASFFNKKYKRRGHLFQGRFQAVLIKNDDQLRNVFVYIHANPTSLIEPEWKEKGVRNIKKVIQFLNKYKWSSYSDYIGKNNFPSLTSRDFLLRTLGNIAGCKKLLTNYIEYKEKQKQNQFKKLELE